MPQNLSNNDHYILSFPSSLAGCCALHCWQDRVLPWECPGHSYWQKNCIRQMASTRLLSHCISRNSSRRSSSDRRKHGVWQGHSSLGTSSRLLSPISFLMLRFSPVSVHCLPSATGLRSSGVKIFHEVFRIFHFVISLLFVVAALALLLLAA